MSEDLRRYRSIPQGRSPTKPCPNPKCNNRLYLTDHKCYRCGVSISKADRTPDNVPCWNCKEFVPFDRESCPRCGVSVFRSEEAVTDEPVSSEEARSRTEAGPPEKTHPATQADSSVDARPTILPDRPWIPVSPTRKVPAPSLPVGRAVEEVVEELPAVDRPSTFAPPSKIPVRNRITWMDSLKISVGVAVAPFIHALLVRLFEVARPYWGYILSYWGDFVCAFEMYAGGCS